MALWYAFDPKLKYLGLISDFEVAKAMYDGSARVALTQLRSIPKGNTIEEDHQRNRQLIAHYIMEKTGAIAREELHGKTYMTVRDYDKMRQGVGMLLAELMRIKGEGDYNAIKALVNQYGVHFDPALRDQVVARYSKLDLPVYWAGIHAELGPRFGPKGEVTAVEISYPRDFAKQQLAFAAMYGKP
jgi:dipeptidyl-peptidase-3